MMETQHQQEVAPQKVRAKSEDPAAPRGRSPLTGAPVPSGRPKGVPNKVTRTIREAVEIAASQVTDSKGTKGLAAWLVERAQGSLGDRQIFAAMVNKALPLQVQANVDGGIRLELGWLSQRQVGTPAAQIEQQTAQVLDLQRENDGTYRIIDPGIGAETVPAGGQAAGQQPEANQADATERPTRRAED